MQVPPEPRPVCSKAPWGRKESCRSCLRWRGRALACASVPDFIIRHLHNPLSTRAPTPRSLCPRAASDGRTPGPVCSSVRAVGGQAASEAHPVLPLGLRAPYPQKSQLPEGRRGGCRGHADHFSGAVVLGESVPWWWFSAIFSRPLPLCE